MSPFCELGSRNHADERSLPLAFSTSQDGTIIVESDGSICPYFSLSVVLQQRSFHSKYTRLCLCSLMSRHETIPLIKHAPNRNFLPWSLGIHLIFTRASYRRFLRARQFGVKNAVDFFRTACQVRRDSRFLRFYENVDVPDYEEARKLVRHDP